jgi:hypothetical protein
MPARLESLHTALLPNSVANFPLYNRVDDSDGVRELIRLVGRTFLAMLDLFARSNLLRPDSPVKNLALMMTMYTKFGV